jgi:ATP-dependent DNA helicase DinG
LSIAFLPGRQEFVDSAKLKNYLGNARADLAPKVRKWVEDGAPSKVACALSDVAKRCGTRLAWLTDDLRDIAGTDLRAEDFSLTNTSDKSCEGAEQHALLRELAAGADIVFCSHKMLALQGTTNWALLPQVVAKDEDDRPLNQPAILIDEAHMFEEAVASATSQELSLFSLRSRLARRQKEIGGGPGSALAKATILTHQLMDLCSKDIYDHTPLRVLRGGFGSDENVDAATSGMLLEKMAALRKLLDTRGTIAGVEDLKNDKAALSGIIRSLQDGDQNCLLMTFSPEKKFPSFSLGSPNVAGDLKRIWDRATGGVGLISATFWLPSWDGKLRTEYIRSILNLPLGRVHCPEPVVWEEIYSVPTRYLPAKEISAALIPPDDFTSQEKMNRWCTAQSAIMSDLLRKPKGGALVLCTSYVQVRTLHEQLVVAGVSEERIIDNSGRLSDDRDKYIALYRRGTMPIFLALGPAWTGFDLKDDKAKLSGDDMLLADLIITRVPLGLNKSVTHEARSSRNFNVNANEACLKLKQGLGRLIRRPGLRDRRLIILDGRLTCDPGLNSTFLKNLANAVYLLIKHYKKKVVIGS